MLVLNLMLIGIAVALDPLPLTAFLVVLPSKRGTVKGAAFVFGWLVSLAIVVIITVLATGNNPPKPATAPSLASLAVKIVLAAVMVALEASAIRSERYWSRLARRSVARFIRSTRCWSRRAFSSFHAWS